MFCLLISSWLVLWSIARFYVFFFVPVLSLPVARLAPRHSPLQSSSCFSSLAASPSSPAAGYLPSVVGLSSFDRWFSSFSCRSPSFGPSINLAQCLLPAFALGCSSVLSLQYSLLYFNIIKSNSHKLTF